MNVDLELRKYGGDKEDSDGYWESFNILCNSIKVGSCMIISWDDGSALVERIDIDDEYQNKGIGSSALEQLSEEYEDLYIVPDSNDSARLYARLGSEVPASSDWSYKDIGYGVYKL